MKERVFTCRGVKTWHWYRLWRWGCFFYCSCLQFYKLLLWTNTSCHDMCKNSTTNTAPLTLSQRLHCISCVQLFVIESLLVFHQVKAFNVKEQQQEMSGLFQQELNRALTRLNDMSENTECRSEAAPPNHIIKSSDSDPISFGPWEETCPASTAGGSMVVQLEEPAAERESSSVSEEDELINNLFFFFFASPSLEHSLLSICFFHFCLNLFSFFTLTHTHKKKSIVQLFFW